jgi:Bacterial regulatory protein, Fis family
VPVPDARKARLKKPAKQVHRKFNQNEIIDALRRNRGLLQPTATELGIQRPTLHRYVHAKAKVLAALVDCREAGVDVSEAKLMERCEEGNLTAIMYHLSMLGRGRGYGLDKGGTLSLGDTTNVTVQTVNITAAPPGTFVAAPVRAIAQGPVTIEHEPTPIEAGKLGETG